MSNKIKPTKVWTDEDGQPRDIVYGWWGSKNGGGNGFGRLPSRPEVGLVHRMNNKKNFQSSYINTPELCSRGMHQANFNKVHMTSIDSWNPKSRLFLTGIFGNVIEKNYHGTLDSWKKAGLYRVYLWEFPNLTAVDKNTLKNNSYSKHATRKAMELLKSKGAPIYQKKNGGWAVDISLLEWDIVNYEGV